MDNKALRFIIILLSPFLILAGCASLQKKQEIDNFFLEKTITDRCNYWTAFEAQLFLKLRSPTYSGRYLLSFYRDRNLLRLDLTSTWGNTLAVVVVKEGESILWLPLEKTIYKNSDPDTFFEKIAGIEGRISDILTLVTGCFSKQQSRFYRIKIDKNPSPTLSNIKVEQKNHVWGITYLPPFSLVPVEATPKIIYIDAFHSNLTLEIRKMEKRIDIPQEVFDILYPPETSVKEL